jgi:hypothetical protein
MLFRETIVQSHSAGFSFVRSDVHPARRLCLGCTERFNQSGEYILNAST